ncbi:hypothetical protein BC831DRAFT_72942 [Entophlyctis helioformis]|nr:hypothetical protein BC831DRAFT_72942 [Entophlyctis helioformis]
MPHSTKRQPSSPRGQPNSLRRRPRSAALQAETQRLENEINATKCTFKEYLDRHIPCGVIHNLAGHTRLLQSGSAAGSAAGSGANTPQSASGLSDGLEILSPSDPPMECMPTEQPPPPPQSSSSSSSSSSSKRPRTDELVFDKSNITSFSIRQGDDTDGPTLVPANFKFHGNMANVNAEKIHLSLWADFDDCVLGNIAKLIMMNGNRDVSWESADRIEKRMALTTVYNEAFLATSYQQIIQDLIHTIKADELALKVVPEFGVSGNRVDLMVLCREHYHVTIEMKVPNSIGSVLGPKPENILKLSVQQHKTYVKNITARGGKDAKIKRATTSQAAGCLYQLITYMATAKVAYGILSTYEHS